MPFEIATEGSFSAAHYLAGYEGNCSNLHGHNWRVRAFIRSNTSKSTGLTYDFRSLKAVIAEVIKPLDHTVLNELSFLEGKNPTAETLAEWCFREISRRIDDETVAVSRVEVWESGASCAAFTRE